MKSLLFVSMFVMLATSACSGDGSDIFNQTSVDGGSGGSDTGTIDSNNTETLVDVVTPDVVETGSEANPEANPDTTVSDIGLNDVQSEADVNTTCNPGDVGCDGRIPWLCDQFGTKQYSAGCPYVCSGSQCMGICVPGTEQCDSTGMILQLCDSTGTWQTLRECITACNPGKTACEGYWVCTHDVIMGTCMCHASQVTYPDAELDYCSGDEAFCCADVTITDPTWKECDCWSQEYIQFQGHQNTCQEWLDYKGSGGSAVYTNVTHCGTIS